MKGEVQEGLYINHKDGPSCNQETTKQTRAIQSEGKKKSKKPTPNKQTKSKIQSQVGCRRGNKVQKRWSNDVITLSEIKIKSEK